MALIAALIYVEWGLETAQNTSLISNHGYTLPIGWQQKVPFEKVICVNGNQDWPFATERQSGESYCDVNNLAKYIDFGIILGFFIGLPILVVELTSRTVSKTRHKIA